MSSSFGCDAYRAAATTGPRGSGTYFKHDSEAVLFNQNSESFRRNSGSSPERTIIRNEDDCNFRGSKVSRP